MCLAFFLLTAIFIFIGYYFDEWTLSSAVYFILVFFGSILNQIKTTSTVAENNFPQAKPGFDIEKDAGPPPTAAVESTKLKQMLAGLKKAE